MRNFETLLNALRVHHWIKNFLLFIPLLTAHKYYDLDLVLILCLAFLSFSLCASSIYIFNDILDIDNDRLHPNKKNRPFASNKLSIRTGTIIASFTVLIGLILSMIISKLFAICLLGYLILSMAYSLFLKSIKYLDCVILVTLYILRIYSGGIVVNIIPSFWLILFSILIFMSLAFAKRYIELNIHYSGKENLKISGRNYSIKDLRKLYFAGITSGYISVLILAIYLGSETVVRLYQSPIFIWIAVPLLLIWISLVWKKSKDKEINDDPIMFSIKNKWSIIIIFLIFLCFFLAQFIEL